MESAMKKSVCSWEQLKSSEILCHLNKALESLQDMQENGVGFLRLALGRLEGTLLATLDAAEQVDALVE
jgi:hypothetical protein